MEDLPKSVCGGGGLWWVGRWVWKPTLVFNFYPLVKLNNIICSNENSINKV